MGSYWFNQGMAFLPIFLVIWTYLTFTISYVIAVSRGDVDPGFPFISDTGARRPESSVFGQMLNISAVTGRSCTIYFYFLQKFVSLPCFFHALLLHFCSRFKICFKHQLSHFNLLVFGNRVL